MSNAVVLAGVASLALVVSAIVALVVVFSVRSKNKDASNPRVSTVATQSTGPTPNAAKISGSAPVGGAIDIRKIAGAPNGSVAPDGSLRVTYPAGGFASKGGLVVGVPVSPPAESVSMSFEVLFEQPGWCWGKGGKLPGLWLGSPSAGCGTGGNWGPNCGSLRFMFDKDGQPYAYIYYPTTKSQPDLSEQTMAYRTAAKDSGKTGHSMFKRELGKLTADGKSWNKMSMSMKLNAVGKMDGSFSVAVNGSSKSFDGMRWRTSADQMIRTVQIHSWHGGGSKEWSCPNVTHARFRNIVVETS